MLLWFYSLMVLFSYGLVVLSSCGLMLFWSYSLMVLFSYGLVVLSSCGLMLICSFWSYGLILLWSYALLALCSYGDIVLYCIVFIHLYSASHSMSHSEALPTTAISTVPEFTRRSATGNCKGRTCKVSTGRLKVDSNPLPPWPKA